MCQEYHCDCCSDELPEDSCACVECYHGDEDFEDVNHFPSTVKCFDTLTPTNICLSKKGCCNSGENVYSDEKHTDPWLPAPWIKRSSGCCDSGENVPSTKPSYCVSQPCDEATDPCREESTCNSHCCSKIDEEGRDLSQQSECNSFEKHTDPWLPAPWIKRSSGCCDSGENVPSTKPSYCVSQPCDEATDPCREESSCNSHCCSKIDEEGRDRSQQSECNSLEKLPQQKEDVCCVKTPPPRGQDADALDSPPCQSCCSGNETSRSETSVPADPLRRTSPDCCEESCRDDCSPCQSPCSCPDKDNGRPFSSSAASSVSTCCDTGSSCQSACGQGKISDVTCRSRNQAVTFTYSSPEDTCRESKPCSGSTCKPFDVRFQSRYLPETITCSSPENKCCNGSTSKLPGNSCCEKNQLSLSIEGLFPRSKSGSRISMTDCSGFYPTTPPSSPRGPPESDSGGETKLVVRENTTKLRVQNICCAMEIKLVQDSLEPLEGVVSIAVNVIGRVVYVRHDPEVTSASELVSTLNRVHLGASIMESGSRHGEDSERMPPSLSSFLIYLLIQTMLLMVGVVAFFADMSWYKWVAIAEIIFGIGPVLRKAYVSIKTCSVDINILMLIAIAGTLAIQEWLEGAAVVYVFSFAEALQEFCMYKVQRTISGLMLKAPQVAILASTGECVPVETITIGTAIAIRPGELIPLDGEVVKGQAAVDESSVSGESVPVEKTVGSKVFSGTVNQNGYLEVETTCDSTTSTVSKVAQLVQEAQTGSTRTEVAIKRFAKYYTPAVVTVAALVVVIPAILGVAGVGTFSEELKEWGRRALVLLVIACPCALLMSSPIAVVCSITAAARKGALIKGGVHLETLAQLQVLAFDKTGTLTEGKFQVVDIECAFGVHERATLRLAAALESKSSHPLAAAVVNEFAGCVAEMVKSQSATLPEVSRFELREGQGISGVVNGHLVQIGNFEFLHRISSIELNTDMEKKFITWSKESKTVIFVCVDGKLAMMIALADTIRPNSLAALDWLRRVRVQTAMITGDNSRTALAVKSELGLDECIAEMKPQDKLSWIKERQDGKQKTDCEVFYDDQESTRPFLPSRSSCRRFIIVKSRDSNPRIVGMVGDGVNDGPALAAANIGIAMGAGGTALAVEAADVALMSNNLAKIPELVELGRFCRRIVAENISLSVVLKLAIVIAVLAGKTTLWMAVLADVLGLLFVVLNGLRPLWWKTNNCEQVKNTDVELAFAKSGQPCYLRESYV